MARYDLDEQVIGSEVYGFGVLGRLWLYFQNGERLWYKSVTVNKSLNAVT